MISTFGLFAILFSIAAIFVTVNKREAKLILFSLVSFTCLRVMDTTALGANHYILMMLIDYLLLNYSTRNNLNLSLTIIFFISILYNALSYLEFNTQYSFIYDSYEAVNRLLITALILSTYITGTGENGKSSGNKLANNANCSSSSSFQARSTQ